MKLFDITYPLKEGMPVWPGDTPFSFTLAMTKEESGSVNVGELRLSTHTGTHIDAPFHFDEEGKKVHELDLSLYIGRLYVLYLPDVDVIEPKHLLSLPDGVYGRLLIRTDSWEDETRFPTSFTTIHPSVARILKQKGVRLLGLDVPSVDPVDSKTLAAHHALHQEDVHILEGARLCDVDEGEYELFALPLHIEGADGSPVRAVLRGLVVC